ncbi:TnsA endonuclease N-terminal domain-containing protein [Ktedonobacter sp. SOSP1-85]|uniref:TnsA endonuclease N-terminal domain-containing protein n=1 Tax=Ktedonobacter sp. SOSP1-85 TaxID=2778367 RepID=UPI001914F8C4
MPVRKVRHHDTNVIVVFQSIKMNCIIRCESKIEGDLPYFLEYDPTVLAYSPQPFTITATDAAGEKHSYTPDFHVIRREKEEIVECKPKERVTDKHTQHQVELGRAWANANDCSFVLVTDEDLRAGHVLANLKLLWRYSRLTIPTILLNRCITYLKTHPQGVSFENLASFLSKSPHNQANSQPFTQVPFIYSMLFRHILQIDLDSPITPSSTVKLAPTTPSTGIIGSLIRGSSF